MVVFLSVEQVLEEVFRDDNEVVSEEEEDLDDEDIERDKIKDYLSKYECDHEFDREFFVEKSAELILPIFIVEAASITRSDGKLICIY